MNEPQHLPARQLSASDQIVWYHAAFFALAFGLFAIWDAVDGPRDGLPCWIWVTHLVVEVVACACLSRVAWTSRRQVRTSEEDIHESSVSEPARDMTFGWLPWMVAFPVVWAMIDFAFEGICLVFGSRVEKYSAIGDEIDGLTGLCAGFVVFAVHRRFTARR